MVGVGIHSWNPPYTWVDATIGFGALFLVIFGITWFSLFWLRSVGVIGRATLDNLQRANGYVVPSEAMSPVVARAYAEAREAAQRMRRS